MSIVKTAEELNHLLSQYDRKNKTLGFVPTMGCLHDGHLSLIKEARVKNDLVVVSIFVNPTQFGPGEDYDKYPRDSKHDYTISREAGADIIFIPETKEIYIPGSSTEVDVTGDLTKKLCGISRPNHFKGVTTVVNILFNIVRPDRAYFGQKDAQQALIIKKMVRDLHIPVEVIVCPIIREPDGLAMSSRNVYLTAQERRQALALNRGLQKACVYLASRAQSCNHTDILTELIVKEIQQEPLAVIEYAKILDIETLGNIHILKPNHRYLAAVAVKFGNTRLIDNIILMLEDK